MPTPCRCASSTMGRFAHTSLRRLRQCPNATRDAALWSTMQPSLELSPMAAKELNRCQPVTGL